MLTKEKDIKELSAHLARLARGAGLDWGWTQQQAAHNSGSSVGRIAHYEAGKAFTPFTFKAIEGLAGVMSERLAGLDAEQRAQEVPAIVGASLLALPREVVQATLGVDDEAPLLGGLIDVPPARLASLWRLAALSLTARVRV